MCKSFLCTESGVWSMLEGSTRYPRWYELVSFDPKGHEYLTLIIDAYVGKISNLVACKSPSTFIVACVACRANLLLRSPIVCWSALGHKEHHVTSGWTHMQSSKVTWIWVQMHSTVVCGTATVASPFAPWKVSSCLHIYTLIKACLNITDAVFKQ